MRTLQLQNHNNKLACEVFAFITSLKMEDTHQIFLIEPIGPGARPKAFFAKIIDSFTFPLCEAYSSITWLTNGINAAEYINHEIQSKNTDFMDTRFVYFFRKDFDYDSK